MFEAITQTAPKMQGGEIPPNNVVALKAFTGIETQAADNSAKPQQEQATPVEEAGSKQVTQKMLEEIEQDIQSIHNVGLQFSMHDETGRTVVKIMDKATDKLIREIPSEEVLNLAAKMEEMIGILFDKKA